ncbi:hypothetical protein FRC09_000278 [Ceratobasidium sp. 395]|nr:hypothetical protein FRC09_000278 [Ceratobasidium sp. 395]
MASNLHEIGLDTEVKLEENKQKITEVVDLIHKLDLTLDKFLLSVIYGNPRARNVGCLKKARGDLRDSHLLPKILDNLHTTPRTASRGRQAPGAVEPLETWAIDASKTIYRSELLDFAEAMKCEVDEVIDEEKLESLTFQSILDAVRDSCPRLMDMLVEIAQVERQRASRQTKKDSTFAVVLFISSLSYQVSQKNNRCQMLVAVYLKAREAAKGVYSLTQRCGMSMSYNWAQKTLDTICDAALDRAANYFSSGACLLVYDNFRLPFMVKHQRADHLSATDNGTTATLIPLPASATAMLNNPLYFVDHRKHVKKLYMAGEMQFINPSDFVRIDNDALINQRLRHNILLALFRIPEVSGLKDEFLNNPMLQAPLPIDPLPFGPEHVSKQCMLGTMDIDESSLSGNDAVMNEILSQLQYSTPEKRQELSVSRMQLWKGDQLTSARGKGLQELRQTDLNSFNRGDLSIWNSGWLHVLINLSRAMYYENYGTSTDLLLARDVATLGWSGLKAPTKNKGPEFHILDEALELILEARYRVLWLWVAKVDSVEALVDWVKKSTPTQLYKAAFTIWSERASDRALQALKRQRVERTIVTGRRKETVIENRDTTLESSVQLQRDLMFYEECTRAIKFGDVGQMNLLVPWLVMYFAGSGKWNYAREFTSMMQWQLYEAPPGFPELVRRNAWLVNFNGKADGFYPVDKRQELNNLSLRLHGPSPQSATWEKYRQISPAIPVLTGVIEHFDTNFTDHQRSRKHYVRSGANDILDLMAKHTAAQVFEFDPSRTTAGAKTPKNVMEAGQRAILYTKYLKDYGVERQKIFGRTHALEVHDSASINDDAVAERLENAYLGRPDRSSEDEASLTDDEMHHSPTVTSRIPISRLRVRQQRSKPEQRRSVGN